MKTLKKGTTGEEVKIMQSIINDGTIEVDGSFGNGTRNKLIEWQKRNGLTPDGVCGPGTWKAMGFYPSKYSNLYVMKIPFTKIERADILLKDKNFSYSVNRFASEYNCDIVINAAMFSMDTRQNVTDLVIDGVVNNGGNYSNKGIAFELNKAYQFNTGLSAGKPNVDFVGGAPTFVMNGVRSIDMKGLTQSYYNQITQRIAVGIDDENIIIITTGQSKKCNLEYVVQEFLYQGAKTAINLDGGGSTAMCIKKKTVFTKNRNIPSVLGIKLKNMWK